MTKKLDFYKGIKKVNNMKTKNTFKSFQIMNLDN